MLVRGNALEEGILHALVCMTEWVSVAIQMPSRLVALKKSLKKV